MLRDGGQASPGGRATWFLGVEFLRIDEESQDRLTRYIYMLRRAIPENTADAEEEET